MDTVIVRFYFLALIFIGFKCSDGISQTIHAYGLKGGVNFFKQYWSTKILTNEYSERLNVGVFVETFKSGHFSLLSEIAYSQKGFETWLEKTTENEPDGTGEFYDVGYKFDYVSLISALMFRKEFSSVLGYAYAGPRLDREIHRKVKIKLFPDEHFKKLLFGASIGVGIEFKKILKQRLIIEAVYCPDLSEQSKTNFHTARNTGFQTRIGMRF